MKIGSVAVFRSRSSSGTLHELELEEQFDIAAPSHPLPLSSSCPRLLGGDRDYLRSLRFVYFRSRPPKLLLILLHLSSAIIYMYIVYRNGDPVPKTPFRLFRPDPHP